MKILLTLFVLFFSSSVVADDISDFEIEGMSIGDSLLDYVSEEEITKKKFYYPKSKKFVGFAKGAPSFKTYEAFQVHFKDDDKKYIIEAIDGMISYENNIEDCYKKMDEIVAVNRAVREIPPNMIIIASTRPPVLVGKKSP